MSSQWSDHRDAASAQPELEADSLRSPGPAHRASVVIPAYNEESVLPRLLDALAAPQGDLEVVVVCNGCTDESEIVARRHPIAATVLSLPEGSKHRALIAGDARATTFPRFYVDADIEIGVTDIHALVTALDEPGVEAVAPARRLDLAGSSWPVRQYYEVWESLPSVQNGLFGRGVLGVGTTGFERIAQRPDVLGDDLFFHQQFAEHERRIVLEAVSVVHAPRTTADLVKRRVRAIRGNRQLAGTPAGESGSSRGRSVAGTLVGMVTQSPPRLPGVIAFVLITIAAHVRARRSAATGGWLRDESSRIG